MTDWSPSLRPTGLKIYSQQIGGSPLSHTFTPDNVAIADGTLQLTVSAGAVEDVKSAQVGTVGECDVSPGPG